MLKTKNLIILLFTFLIVGCAEYETNSNNIPVANAGANQNVYIADTVSLNGSNSKDIDGDDLTYTWSIVSKPNGSSAGLINENNIDPFFQPDRVGEYIISLTVNDGENDSSEDRITVVVSYFTYSTITSSVTGKVWMDRNLGASRACTSFDDTQCYGDYYQWGRDADGHEKSTSSTTSTQATSTSSVGHGDFILDENWDYSRDWAKNADSNGAIRSANWNPCPTGYRIPTIEELEAESIDDRDDAYSKLKLPSAGYRNYSSGSLGYQGSRGYIWSGSVGGSYSEYLGFSSSNAYSDYDGRAFGLSVRCLREE